MGKLREKRRKERKRRLIRTWVMGSSITIVVLALVIAGFSLGRPKKQEVIEDNQNKANGFSEKQEETKKADNESESDKDNDKDNESDKDSSTKKKKNKKEKAPAVDYEGMLECSSLSSGLIDKIMEWVQYKQAKKKPYTELGFKSFITQVEKYEREYGTENVIDVVTRTMSNEYIGIVWDWLKNMKKPTPAGKVDWDNI